MARYDQATKIINKFGSPYKMAEYVRISPATIYKWTWSRERGGTDGLIPARSMQEVIRGARIAGILLTAQDLFPEVVRTEKD